MTQTAVEMGIKIGPSVTKEDWYAFSAPGSGIGLEGDGRIVIRMNVITKSAGDDNWERRKDFVEPLQ